MRDGAAGFSGPAALSPPPRRDSRAGPVMLCAMGRNSAVWFVIAAVVLGVSGCDSVSGVPGDGVSGAATSTTAPSEVTDQSTTAAKPSTTTVTPTGSPEPV